MFPFININKKIVFWWSPKCGCSSVKTLMLQMMGLKYANPHVQFAHGTFRSIKNTYNTFIHILFVRNIFDRFISGFLDKYIDGTLNHEFKPLSFYDTVLYHLDSLDKLHFLPQTAYEFNKIITYDYIYNINNINYEELSDVCNYKFFPIHKHKNYSINEKYTYNKIWNFKYEELVMLKHNKKIPKYYTFFNQDIIEKLNIFYKKDIIFFKNLNLKNCYTLNLPKINNNTIIYCPFNFIFK
jgi:hypothetical protein